MEDAVSVRSAMAWVGDVATRWRHWVRAHLGMTILLSALAFAFGWAWNTYVMAVNLDGSDPGPDQATIATAQGRPFNSLFWLLLFGLLSGLITYGWQRGWRNLFADLAVLPRRFGDAVSHHSGGAFAMLLWGLGISLIISTVISSAVSLALGLVLLTLSATPIGTIVNFAVIRLWRALAGIVAPTGGLGAVLAVGPFLVMIGEAAGLLLDWLFNSWPLGLVVGVAAAVVSVVLARGAGGRPSPGAAAGVLIGLTFSLYALWSGRAWADDGGWSECQTPDGQACSDLGLGGVFAWFGSEGADVVLAHGALGAAFAGLGTAIGVGAGSVAASVAVAAAAAGLNQPAQDGKATGRANPPRQPSVPQQSQPQEGVPTAWGGSDLSQQTGPQETGLHQSGPQHGVPHQAGPHEAGPPPESGGGHQTVGFEEPTIAQQPTPGQPSIPQPSPPIDDVLPEPPDRKRDKDNEDGNP